VYVTPRIFYARRCTHMKDFLIALVALAVIIALATRCRCGCWAWCKCRGTASTCCCNGGQDKCGCGCAEALAVNATRTVHLHYTNWCGACAHMKPVWAQVKAAAAGSGIKFMEIDEDVAHTPGVTRYPTIMMINEHGRTSLYNGPASAPALQAWIMDPAA